MMWPNAPLPRTAERISSASPYARISPVKMYSSFAQS